MTEKSFEPNSDRENQFEVDAQKLVYRKPQIINLGSLDKVQANYGGSAYDGPDRAYYYR